MGFGGIVVPDGGPAPSDIRLQAVLGRNSSRKVQKRTNGVFQVVSASGPVRGWEGAAPGGAVLVGEGRLDGGFDADRLVAALERYGSDALVPLSGEFALAYWDPRRRELVLARDHMGVRPLYYRMCGVGNGCIAFATDAAALRAIAIPEPDEGTAALHLAGLPPEHEGAGVLSLPAGHWLRWRPERSPKIARYWSLVDAAEEQGPVEDAVSGYAERFGAAVTVRSQDRTAALLSGGLDSSAIASVASRYADGPLSTYSMIYPGQPDVDESGYIDAVLRRGSFAPVQIDMSSHAPLAALPALLREQGGLFQAPGLTAMRAVYSRAAADGVAILLDGHGGDEVAWDGVSYLLELLSKGRWGRLTSLIPTVAAQRGEGWASVLAQVLQNGKPSGVAGRGLRWGSRRLLGAGATGAALPGKSWYRHVRPDLVQRHNIVDRLRAEETRIPDRKISDRANQLHALTSPLVAHSFNVLARAADAAGLDLRFPFYDRRLAAFCLALPGSEKIRRGELRSLPRRALAGDLPVEVRNRRDKTDFAAHLARGIAKYHSGLLDEMAADRSGRLGALIEMAALRETLHRLRDRPVAVGGDDALFVWRAAALHLLDRARTET